jgi:outer membrane protein assembly factor BamA
LKSHLFNTVRKLTFFLVFFCISISVLSQITSLKKISSFKTVNPADSVSKLQLRKVFITGNKKTKYYIILREMQMKEGDSITIFHLNNRLEKARQQVFNTRMFIEVKIEPEIVSPFQFDLNVTVKERWYIFPLPEIQFVGSSLNEWLAKYKGDLSRLNYGAKFTHNNLSGRRDKLRVHILNGYTQTIYFNYDAPYINPALTKGFSVGGGFSQNREITYKTAYDNNHMYFKKNNFISKSWNIHAGYSVRKAIKKSEWFGMGYTHTNVDDSIISAEYNSAYNNKSKSKIGFFDFAYYLQYVDVNNVFYPLTGRSASFSLQKKGLGFTGGINVFTIDGEYNKFWSLGKKWYSSMQLQGNIKLPFNQPYVNQQALGYGNNYVRGLEYKIVDGVAYVISKINLKKELFVFSINTIFKKSKIFNKIPFKIYAKTFADMGYSYIRPEFATQLNNTFLGSAGVGLDIITFYDLQLRIEYSINQLGQNRLFLHNEKGF